MNISANDGCTSLGLIQLHCTFLAFIFGLGLGFIHAVVFNIDDYTFNVFEIPNILFFLFPSNMFIDHLQIVDGISFGLDGILLGF